MSRRLRYGAVALALVGAFVAPVGTRAEEPARHVQAFGAATHLGEPTPPPAEAVDLEARPDGSGYWTAAADGSVFGYGKVAYFGSMGGTRLRDRVVAMSATPGGGGYWLAAADGSVFGFGDAGYFGSMGGKPLSFPVTGLAPTPTGRGYFLLGLDGSVFGFGDARYFGSLGARPLNSPLVQIVVTPSGGGYWLAAADGSVFGFGDAGYFGSAYDPGRPPVTAMARTSGGLGYWLLRLDGSVEAFGDARSLGSATPGLPPEAAAVDFAPTSSDTGYLTLSTPGALRISAAGDVHGEGRVRSLLDRGGNPLAHVAAELRSDDLTTVNLETPVGPPGRPAIKTYVFLAPESLLPALESAGVDVVGVANNHTLDHGIDAMLRTLALSRRHGLSPVGAGTNRSSAYTASVHPVRGRTIAVVGLTRVLSAGWDATAGRPGVASAHDEAAVVQAVRAADHLADVVVVTVHWGIERDRCPDAHQRRLVRLMTDAGADVIAGHHPHVLQGLDPGPAFAAAYSLGNFVWYHSSGDSGTTAVLRTEHPPAGGVRARMLPAEIDASGSPRFTNGPQADAVRREVASLQPGRGRC